MAYDFNMANKSFIELMGNGFKYSVPKFQRNYSWEEEQWDELWSDIINEDIDSPWHYMGYLLLQPNVKDTHQYQVIDGQQRIATITLIIIAVLNELKNLISKNEEPEDNLKRLSAISGRYITFVDPVSLKPKRKITLNHNNKNYFNKLCDLEEPMVRGAKASNELMNNALEFFRKKIKDEKIASGEGLAKFVSKLEDKLFFTTIEVENDFKAYTVFETLNARGVKLSTPDLVKNYLFSQIDKEENVQEEEFTQLEEDWGGILTQLGDDSNFSRFIEVEWNSRNIKIHKSKLFRTIKNETKDKEPALNYVKKLEKTSEIYAALGKPKDGFWEKIYQNKDAIKKIENSLTTLKVFGIKQPHSLLISVYFNLPKDDFAEIARYLEIIAIRYNVICRGHPNEQEAFYNQMAYDISNGVIKNAYTVKNKLKEIYKNDEEFTYSFERKTIKSNSDARYILEKIEEYIKPSHKVPSNATLEHILPKKYSSEWLNSFLGRENEDYIWRIGNMALLDKKSNERVGNSGPSDKMKLLAGSDFEINKTIAEYDDWTPEAIDERQKWLAEQAVKCWRIDFE